MIFFIGNVENVLDGEMPEDYKFEFVNVVERAKRLLGRWDYHELKEQIDDINWLIFKLDLERRNPTGESGVVDPGEKDATIPSLIRNHIDEIELNQDTDFSWSQYFGLLALGIIGEALATIHVVENYEVDDMRGALPAKMGSAAIDAVEAVSFGEAFLDAERRETSIEAHIELKTKKSISLRNSKAAIQSHSKINKLKQDFIQFYLSGEHQSRAEAARRFLMRSSEERRSLLVPTNAVRTLTDALRAYEKQLPAISKSVN